MLERIPWTALVLGALLACAEDRLADGSLCGPGDACRGGPCTIVGFDCSSGSCEEYGYCEGGGCSNDGDCADGWTCDRVQTQEASFLGIIHDDEFANLCVPHCPCQDMFSCDDNTCEYDPEWTAEGAPVLVIVAPQQAGVGTPVNLRVDAASPTGAEIADITWYFHGGEPATGPAIEHTFAADEVIERESVRRFYFTVEVSDSAGNTSKRTDSLARCSLAGEACGDYDVCCGGASLCTYTPDPNDEPGTGTCSR
jgi:hypothetical protein